MLQSPVDFPLRKLAFLGAFLPRSARTAFPNTSIVNSFVAEFSDRAVLALAVSDAVRVYSYPSRVHYEISQENAASYRAAADFLHHNQVDMVCILYDQDIFGSVAGQYILDLALSVKTPVVTAFGSLPDSPEPPQQQSIFALANMSSHVVVYQPGTGKLLRETYGVPAQKVTALALPAGAAQSGKENWPGPEDPAWRETARVFMACFQKALQTAALRTVQRIAEQRAGDGSFIPVTGDGIESDVMHSALTKADGSGLPVLKLDHFLRMTDDTGLFKGSVLGLPDYRQGYTTADNARALMFSLLLEQVGEGPFIPIETQASRHLAFLWNAFDEENGRFRGALSYQREWLEDTHSINSAEATHGLALWALGRLLGRSTTHPGLQGVARRLFEGALPVVKQFSSLAGWGYSLLGIQAYLARFAGDRAVARTGNLIRDRLVGKFRQVATPDWPWFEEGLASSSASISQALIESGRRMGDHQAAEIGMKTLDWLASLQFQSDGMFTPLGHPGYLRRGGSAARFTQRPAEAQAMISACLEAYRMTYDTRWLSYARGAFQWFLGRNDLGQSLYDPETGGCRDGLAPGSLGSGYSADSLLAFLVAQLEMRLFDQLHHQQMHSGTYLPILQIGQSNPLIHPLV